MIDLLVRLAPGSTWKPGPYPVQDKEYERSARALGRTVVQGQSESSLTCLVNPSNPTGDWKPIGRWIECLTEFNKRIDEMKQWILDNANPGSWVVIGKL